MTLAFVVTLTTMQFVGCIGIEYEPIEEVKAQRPDVDNAHVIAAEMSRKLTEEELIERDQLRRIYIDSVTGNLKNHLENTTIVYPDGSKKKVTHK